MMFLKPYCVYLSILCILLALLGQSSDAKPTSSYIAELKENLAYRPTCQKNASRPAARVETGDRLRRLRLRLKIAGYDGYIIQTSDGHQNEGLSPYDMRREYISGFSGSQGLAVVLRDGPAAVWTDSRYFLQAEQELDCNWQLVKTLRGAVSLPKWAGLYLPRGSKLAADPRLVPQGQWLRWGERLRQHNITLETDTGNLVDDIWTRAQGRPASPTGYIDPYPLKYSGKAWQYKIRELRDTLQKKLLDGMILTALDEVAWLFNLRGSDTPDSPVFKAFAFVSREEIRLYVGPKRLSKEAQVHLHLGNCSAQDYCIKALEYGAIYKDLNITRQRILVPNIANYAIYRLVPENKRVLETSPVLLTKAVKNPVEREGMKKAHLRESVALAQLISQLEDEAGTGLWNEMKIAARMSELRLRQDLCRGDSFPTVSAVDANAAIVHYIPRNVTNKQLKSNSILLLDTGGQYLDGTTDTTRTFHFGQPTAHQSETYTRVLMGVIDLMLVVFPEDTPDIQLNLVSRHALHQSGLDFGHGSSHGIGHYLNVHEGPTFIGPGSGMEIGNLLKPGMFLSNEPGYYEEGKFGIRLETTVTVVEAKTKYHNGNRTFYQFVPAIYFPFQPKFITKEIMEPRHLEWLNDYHMKTRQILGLELQRQGSRRALEWLLEQTEHLELKTPCSQGVRRSTTAGLLAFLASVALWICT